MRTYESTLIQKTSGSSYLCQSFSPSADNFLRTKPGNSLTCFTSLRILPQWTRFPVSAQEKGGISFPDACRRYWHDLCCSCTCLDGLRDIRKNLGQDIRCPVRNSNPVSSEYEYRAIRLLQPVPSHVGRNRYRDNGRTDKLKG